MLSEPVSLTVDSTAVSLPRVASGDSASGLPSIFASKDGVFSLTISEKKSAGGRLIEVILGKTDRSTGIAGSSNAFGFTVFVDSERDETEVIIPHLRAALTSFMDAPMLERIIGGEK